MRLSRFGVLLPIAGLLFTVGCVSKGRYNQIAAGYDERGRKIQEQDDQIAALKAEKDAMEARLAKPVTASKDAATLPAGVTQTPRGLRVEDRVLFQTASADLTAEGKSVLARVASILQQSDVPAITIEGHADDRPIVKPETRKRWPGGNQQLSEARAKAVADFLITKGVTGDKIRTVGYGSTRPIVQGKTETARRQNRRVEISFQ
ncbi:MAG: OmpA family protein [Planctomycetota bacterium]